MRRKVTDCASKSLAAIPEPKPVPGSYVSGPERAAAARARALVEPRSPATESVDVTEPQFPFAVLIDDVSVAPATVGGTVKQTRSPAKSGAANHKLTQALPLDDAAGARRERRLPEGKGQVGSGGDGDAALTLPEPLVEWKVTDGERRELNSPCPSPCRTPYATYPEHAGDMASPVPLHDERSAENA